MAPDALFRIASQTKALTSVATLMLVEDGRVALSDPVSKFIPSFRRTTVASRTDSGTAIVPARAGSVSDWVSKPPTDTVRTASRPRVHLAGAAPTGRRIWSTPSKGW